jgi:hypothetical protein
MLVLTRSQLSKRYNITRNSWERRHDELLEYLSEFISIKEVLDAKSKRYVYEINEDELPDIPQIPRKSQMEEKIKDYSDFTIASLDIDFKPNSKRRIAKNAIYNFGLEKYHHSSDEAVARRFISPIMESKGEHNNTLIWVYYDTYEPIEKADLEYWRNVLDEEKINEREAANAFYRYAEGEDVSEEVSSYQRAIKRFKEKYGTVPVRVYSWRLKK